MPVSLTTPTFGQCILAKNPVIFEIRALDDTLQPYAAQGASAKVTGGTTWANGGTLTVTYTEPDGTSESVVFTADADYIEEDEIPDASFVGSISVYWEAVRTKVAAHHRIAPYFEVFRTGPIGGNSLIFKARSSDPDWEIELANTEGFTVTADTPTENNTPINYSVMMEVYVERTYKAGDYVLAAQLENTPDTDGYLTFDISSVLAAECRAGMAEPVVPQWGTDASLLSDNVRRFYIRYTERYGSPIVAQEWEYDAVRLCMNGGVSQSLWAAGDFLAGLDATDSLLTWMPDGRKLGVNQPEFLAWYNYDTETRPVLVQMRWYDIADNSLNGPTTHLTTLDVAPGETGLLPVGPAVLELDTEDAAYKYQVRVIYIDDALNPVALSQWRTYYIDREYFHSERYIQYLNGFGAPECWRCTGVWAKRLQVTREVAAKPLLPNFNELATDRFQFSALFEQELTYNTGFIRRSEAEVLQEMMIAGEIYDVSEDGYIPLSITSKTFDVTDTNETLHAYRFAALPRLEMRNYSKKKTNLMSGVWQEVGGQAWFDAFLIPWELPA